VVQMDNCAGFIPYIRYVIMNISMDIHRTLISYTLYSIQYTCTLYLSLYMYTHSYVIINVHTYVLMYIFVHVCIYN